MKIKILQDIELEIINEIDSEGTPTDIDHETFHRGDIVEADIIAKYGDLVDVQFGDGSIGNIPVGFFQIED